MAKVFNLSVEKGVARGVGFSPVLRGGCWVGEGETSDPVALAFFAKNPALFEVLHEPRPSLDPLLNPPQVGVITAAARAQKAEIVLTTGSGGEPIEVIEQPEQLVQQDASNGWPEGLEADIIAKLTDAEWTPEDVKASSDAQLEALKGIGKAAVKKIRAAFA